MLMMTWERLRVGDREEKATSRRDIDQFCTASFRKFALLVYRPTVVSQTDANTSKDLQTHPNMSNEIHPYNMTTRTKASRESLHKPYADPVNLLFQLL